MSLTGKRRTLIDPITGEALIPNTTPEAAGTFGKEDIASTATKGLIGLGADAKPDAVLQELIARSTGSMPMIPGTKGQVLTMGDSTWEAQDAPTGLIQSYPIADDVTIAKGDVVDIIDGKVNTSFSKTRDIYNLSETAQFRYRTVAMNENYSIIASVTNSKLFVINNKTQEEVYTTTFYTSTSNSVYLLKLSSANFVIAYAESSSTENQIKMRLGTIASDGTVTFGAVDSGTVTGQYVSMVRLTDTKFIAFYSTGKNDTTGCVKWALFSISGTYVSRTNMGDSNIGKATAIHLTAEVLETVDGNFDFVVFYVQSNIKALHYLNGTINGNTVTFTANSTMMTGENTSGVCSYISSCTIGDKIALMCTYSQGSTPTYYTELRIFTYDGSLTGWRYITLETAASYFTSVTATNTHLIATAFNHAHLIKVTDTTAELVCTETLENTYSTEYVIASAINNSSFFTSLQRTIGNTGIVGYTLSTIKGDDFAGSYVYNCTEAIALQDGTSGDTIKIAFIGNVNVPGIAAGTRITSNGAQGYAPVDNTLNVIPFWLMDIIRASAGAKIVAGSYTGTGTFGPNNPSSITFDFVPKFVIIPLMSDSGHHINYNAGPEHLFLYWGVNAQYNYGGRTGYVNFSGNTMSWYHDYAAEYQFNNSNIVYYYIAIG